jgi:hypothetical protein
MVSAQSLLLYKVDRAHVRIGSGWRRDKNISRNK